MNDLQLALFTLRTDGHSVVACKEGRVLGGENGPGVVPFLRLVARLGRTALQGASLADLVVGRAVALGCVDLRVAAVHAVLASETALAALREAGIPVVAERRVEIIMNRGRTGPCPTEELVRHCTEPAAAIPLLEAFVSQR